VSHPWTSPSPYSHSRPLRGHIPPSVVGVAVGQGPAPGPLELPASEADPLLELPPDAPLELPELDPLPELPPDPPEPPLPLPLLLLLEDDPEPPPDPELEPVPELPDVLPPPPPPSPSWPPPSPSPVVKAVPPHATTRPRTGPRTIPRARFMNTRVSDRRARREIRG
jgi:homeobox protein ESX1